LCLLLPHFYGEVSERRPWAFKREDRPKGVPNSSAAWSRRNTAEAHSQTAKLARKQRANLGGKHRDPLHPRSGPFLTAQIVSLTRPGESAARNSDGQTCIRSCFALRPRWPPSLDVSLCIDRNAMRNNGVPGFERGRFHAARVRNVSSVGNQFICATLSQHFVAGISAPEVRNWTTSHGFRVSPFSSPVLFDPPTVPASDLCRRNFLHVSRSGPGRSLTRARKLPGPSRTLS